MKKIFLWTVLALALVAVFTFAAWREFATKPEPLPVMVTVPDFSLIERSGQTFGLGDLKGQIWIADFIFTSCGGTCPMMTTQMTTIQQALEEQGVNEVKLVSFTVDPETDTPAVLRQFADGYGARPDRWFFLTGPGEEIQELATQGFRLSAATGEAATDEGILHSIRFVLVDRQARVRGYYDGTDPETVKILLRDLESLIKERPS